MNGLDNRLLACASFVRKNCIAADIGSDHAYLPIYLVKNGICKSAIASDINKGPVERAKINIMVAGLCGKVIPVLADGLDKACMYLPDDIIIAGMGGELIRDILKASDYVKSNKVRLILQPMTMPDVLRAYLCKNGFNIIDEKVCSAAGKCYVVICAEFDGRVRKESACELIVGKKIVEKIKAGSFGENEKFYITRLLRGANVRISGMKKSKMPDECALARERELALYLEKALTYFGGKNDYC